MLQEFNQENKPKKFDTISRRLLVNVYRELEKHQYTIIILIAKKNYNCITIKTPLKQQQQSTNWIIFYYHQLYLINILLLLIITETTSNLCYYNFLF